MTPPRLRQRQRRPRLRRAQRRFAESAAAPAGPVTCTVSPSAPVEAVRLTERTKLGAPFQPSLPRSADDGFNGLAIAGGRRSGHAAVDTSHGRELAGICCPRRLVGLGGAGGTVVNDHRGNMFFDTKLPAGSVPRSIPLWRAAGRRVRSASSLQLPGEGSADGDDHEPEHDDDDLHPAPAGMVTG
jgi:hypothetical protein